MAKKRRLRKTGALAAPQPAVEAAPPPAPAPEPVAEEVKPVEVEEVPKPTRKKRSLFSRDDD
jgi:hypothetical protein